jgi:hypothetical protein
MDLRLDIFSLEHWNELLEGDRWSGRTQSPVSYSPEQARFASTSGEYLAVGETVAADAHAVVPHRRVLRWRRTGEPSPESTPAIGALA